MNRKIKFKVGIRLYKINTYETHYVRHQTNSFVKSCHLLSLLYLLLLVIFSIVKKRLVEYLSSKSSSRMIIHSLSPTLKVSTCANFRKKDQRIERGAWRVFLKNSVNRETEKKRERERERGSGARRSSRKRFIIILKPLNQLISECSEPSNAIMSHPPLCVV